MTERCAQILIAGVGNTWMRDDGFGAEVVRVLKEREPEPGVTIEDFGTGGLDLAYEVMRGYDSLVLIDVMRGDGPPGTLYVLEPEEAEIAAGIEDGEMIDPHAMDPQTVLRFVRAVSGWPGNVVVIACEPVEVEDYGMGLSPEVAGAVPRAVELVAETLVDLRRRRSAQARCEVMHELALAGAVIDTAERHAGGRRVLARAPAARRAPPGRARLARLLFRARRTRHALRGRGPRARGDPRRPRLRRLRRDLGARFGHPRCQARPLGVRPGQPGRPRARVSFRCPACGGADVGIEAGSEFEVESIEVEEPACTG